MNQRNIWAWILGGLGLLIVFGTHIVMVANYFNDTALGFGLTHATLNLVAGVLLLVAFLLKK